MADLIYDFAEKSAEEYKSMELLTDYLQNEGFTVERGIALDTAFRATWDNCRAAVDDEEKNTAPVLGILVEYDALEDIGHACGHHMQGPAGIGAAIAIKDVMKDYPFKLVIYGTPAEETLGGKIVMLDAGYMKELDLALMSHGSPNTSVDEKCMALENFVVTFHGVKSHAAISPDEGRSALDAALLSFHAIEMLREHVKDDTRMHYTIRNAGGPPNVVPDLTVAEYTLRSYSTSYLNTVVERFYNILKGAALMTDTTYDIQRDLPFKSKIVCHSVNDLLMKNAAYEKAPSIAAPRKKTGSTDFGNVLYEIPGSCIRIAFTKPDAQPHSQEYLEAGKTDKAHDAICYAAKIMADTFCDVITTPGLLTQIKEEFYAAKQKE
ncbi:amidohydrolase [Agathobacter rectalis]|uniref:amidohydrolase n=1 Tax=Agathobacter rectalis TaxID=39491 RepID=UPI0027D2363C|nr:amidohydrolase [Agathobacter rectalis]